MKKCPKCHMTVDAYSECPVCGNELTDELITELKTEKYVINKYFFIYLMKKHLFSVILTIIVLLHIVLSIKSLGYWQLISILLISIMWIGALYKNVINKIFSSIYSDEYLEATHKITIYACGIFAVVTLFL